MVNGTSLGLRRVPILAAALCAVLVQGLALGGCKAEYPEARHPELVVPQEVPAWVDVEELARWIGHEDITVVDARPARAWRSGHVPGSVQVDWVELRRSSSGLFSGDVMGAEGQIARLLGERGISSEDWIVVVGDPLEGWGEEGRIAWTLLWLGQARLSVLDGGFPAWKKAGEEVQRGTLVRPETTYRAEPRPQLLASKSEVVEFSARREDWSWVLVDSREPAEFRGSPAAPTYGAARKGHIPGAVNLSWRSVLDAEGRLLPAEELQDILIPRGIRPDARIVTYCTGGVRSAHTWYVLHSLGYPVVANYSGSWWEWSLDWELPLELGGARARPEAPPWPPESLPR